MTDYKIVRVGRVFYKYRAVIAVPFFIVLVVLSRLPHSLYILSYLLIVTGLLLRIWAAGYIGARSRKKEFSADFVVINGPYHYLKHPLYLGNFFLVVGVVFLFNPPPWLTILLIALFIVEYSMIIYSEMNYLKSLSKKRVKFKLINIKGEISTTLILLIIYLVYLGKLIAINL